MKKCTDTWQSPIDTACAMAFLPFTIKMKSPQLKYSLCTEQGNSKDLFSSTNKNMPFHFKEFLLSFYIDIIKIWKNGVLLKKFNAFRTKSII